MSSKFWASKDSLGLGHWGKTDLQITPQFLSPTKFHTYIQQGYQVNATLNQGYICDPRSNHYCRWQYSIKPIYGWGNPQRSSASNSRMVILFAHI